MSLENTYGNRKKGDCIYMHMKGEKRDEEKDKGMLDEWVKNENGVK